MKMNKLIIECVVVEAVIRADENIKIMIHQRLY